MIAEQLFPRDRPGLLISVRSADEALAALAGGAHVIDVKEPNRGALGAADRHTIADIIRTVDGRAPVTAAAGELVDIMNAPINAPYPPMPRGVVLAKIGLAGCKNLRDWQSHWRNAIALHCQDADAAPVAVAYADWRSAAAPHPDEIHSAAVNIRCPVVLIDTWDKSRGTLFDHWAKEDLRLFIERVCASGQAIVLAGSLSGRNLLAAAELRPHLVAVRGAACDAGRNGTISRNRVAELRQALASVATFDSTTSRRGAAARA